MSAETQAAVVAARKVLFLKARARDYGAATPPPRYAGPGSWTALVNAYEAAVRADMGAPTTRTFSSGFSAAFE